METIVESDVNTWDSLFDVFEYCNDVDIKDTPFKIDGFTGVFKYNKALSYDGGIGFIEVINIESDVVMAFRCSDKIKIYFKLEGAHYAS